MLLGVYWRWRRRLYLLIGRRRRCGLFVDDRARRYCWRRLVRLIIVPAEVVPQLKARVVLRRVIESGMCVVARRARVEGDGEVADNLSELLAFELRVVGGEAGERRWTRRWVFRYRRDDCGLALLLRQLRDNEGSGRCAWC